MPSSYASPCSALLLFLLILSGGISGNPGDGHWIKVHFLHGSKPKHAFRHTEPKYLGGLHGGHVSIQFDSVDVGFETNGRVHLLPHPHHPDGLFKVKLVKGADPYPDSARLTTVHILLPDSTYDRMKRLLYDYAAHTPYDYAFLGMRCASATQDILARLQVLPKKRRMNNILTTFYPRKLRRRVLKMAADKNYRVVRRDGRRSRIWEKD
jgi:hypothetical protein